MKLKTVSAPPPNPSLETKLKNSLGWHDKSSISCNLIFFLVIQMNANEFLKTFEPVHGANLFPLRTSLRLNSIEFQLYHRHKLFQFYSPTT